MKNISEYLSYVLIISISILSITIAIYFLNPIIEKNLNSIAIQEAINNIKGLEKVIKDVLSEAIGSKRVFEFKISRGNFFLKNSSIIYILESQHIPFDDFSKKENNLLIQKTGNIFLLNLSFEIVNLSGEFYLSSGNYKICIQKEDELKIKLFVC